MSPGKAVICEHCLTQREALIVCGVGQACPRCEAMPDPGALTVGEIRTIVQSWRQ